MNIIKVITVIVVLTIVTPLLADSAENTNAADDNSNNENTTASPQPTAAPSEPATPATAQEIASGVCAGCHNADGNSIIPANPILAGQHVEYLSKQLHDFKASENEPAKRNSPVMSAMVAALSPEDMKKVSEYYAKQKKIPSPVEADAKLLEAGKTLYHGGNIDNGVPACASCHGPQGAGIPPHYPALAGQHAEYVNAQLNQFNTGDRTNDNGVMQKVITRMSGKEKRAVSAYIASMHP
nr:c-type cytochrome [Nitrosomonas sp. PY1]